MKDTMNEANSVLQIPLGRGMVAIGTGTNVEDGKPVLSIWQLDEPRLPVGKKVEHSAGHLVPIDKELVRFRIDDVSGIRSLIQEAAGLLSDSERNAIHAVLDEEG